MQLEIQINKSKTYVGFGEQAGELSGRDVCRKLAVSQDTRYGWSHAKLPETHIKSTSTLFSLFLKCYTFIKTFKGFNNLQFTVAR